MYKFLFKFSSKYDSLSVRFEISFIC